MSLIPPLEPEDGEDFDEFRQFPVVLCHNDAQENNILMNSLNNLELIIIDQEFAGWNPMAMDLANYLNETMIDNAYPFDNGIAVYPQNALSDAEID